MPGLARHLRPAQLRPSVHVHLHQPCASAAQVVNPATGEVIAKAPGMKGAETQTAIAAAATAFPTWSRLVAKERCKVMRRRAVCPWLACDVPGADVCIHAAVSSGGC